MPHRVRIAQPGDMATADRIACRAYAEYEKDFPEWVPSLCRGLPKIELAREAQALVAEVDGAIAGTVGYVAAHMEKHAAFPREWAAFAEVLALRLEA